MEVNQEAKAKNLAEIMQCVEGIFKVLDRYEPSRPSSLGFTKLEEAVLWFQVMIQQVPLRTEKNDQCEDEKKAEIVVDV